MAEEDFSLVFQYKDEKIGDGFLAKLSLNGGLSRVCMFMILSFYTPCSIINWLVLQEFGKDGTLELFQFFSEEHIERPPKEAQLKVSYKQPMLFWPVVVC